ncbi:hypothetical protein BDF20DRAFT_860243 [Mycotypha africana]|uniref:uncharacterized protein n=1 Tax=Mycotypha africana TaxID=64632 RepID=UPI002300AA13|nr:uncharacterized protein BDF20DRAFT_860243 [Mycotypha africana]KAI8984483.1 hypothetical protein BDF20DRAFT_860243 [Mycotypha africana]
MKNTIRNLFHLKKKSKKEPTHNNTTPMTEFYTPSSSVSSFSTDSSMNDSMPQTPTSVSIQDSRGIFRTLEPVWYFNASLLPNHPAQNSEWVRFDERSQAMLESSLSKQNECTLNHTAVGTCTVLFRRPQTTKAAANHRLSYSVKHHPSHYNSMPTLHPQQQQQQHPKGRTLEMNKHVRRTMSPVWWFEQDAADGSKGMCRFDYKNQVRLEALSEGRTRMMLTDDAFNVPFTVALEPPKERESREEVRGFLFFEPVATAFQLAYHTCQAPSSPMNSNKMEAALPVVEGSAYEVDDLWGHDLLRRFSI